MKALENIIRPSKSEQITAIKSYESLVNTLKRVKSENIEMEIEESKEKITIPTAALELLGKVLKAMSEGQPVSIVPIATELSTQAASEFLGCSRPHLVKLLEEGKIPFTKVGKHRRVKFEDLNNYRKKMKAEQKQRLIDMMKSDEDTGLYDS
ncbi:MAG: helix-turn-helix domain-containing protein [Brumimicrobium sp.]